MATVAVPIRSAIAAGAMVLILGGMVAAFVYGAVPAVAGPAGPVPALIEVHTDTPATLPACTEITEDSVNPACVDAPADPVPANAALDDQR
ncbi:hypothetical protein ACFXHA_35045 [Nocardia sp. NPDC059240]|uniref:hypothetical protein n=1 Tax=Nocardia sp. NPDC059240 TaxID=3346786 RepID=UPI00368CC332